jgi:hypothetical protein
MGPLLVGGCLLLPSVMSPVSSRLLMVPRCRRRGPPPTRLAFWWNGHRLGLMLFCWLLLRFVLDLLRADLLVPLDRLHPGEGIVNLFVKRKDTDEL